MGAACSSAKEVVIIDPETHKLQSRPTGTLIYSHKRQDAGQDKTQSLIFNQKDYFGDNISMDDIETMDMIGEGSYGQVFKARYKPRKKRVALKKILVSNQPSEKAEIVEDFEKEVQILQVTNHERIILFLGSVNEDPNFCMLFELAAGSVGSLLKSVENNQVKVTWRMGFQIAVDAAEACVYLHDLEPKIIHRDLKAENLLLDDNFRCKLSDFGLSRTFERKSQSHMTICGTPCWVAPEIFRGDAYSEKVDVYSFGIVLWELFSFIKPYGDEDAMELPFKVAKRGLRPPVLDHCPPTLNELMAQCWLDHAEKRPSMTNVLALLEDGVNQELIAAGCFEEGTLKTIEPKKKWANQ